MIGARLIDGTTLPIQTVFAIGRNYVEHARELDSPVPGEPVVFIKPTTSILQDGGTIVLPEASRDVHHEVELVVLLGAGGRHVPAADALELVAGYGVGIDVTARDLQAEAKRLGQPWTVAKGFDTFAPVSKFVPAGRVPDPHALVISLGVNGERRQWGQTRDMLFGVGALIGYLSGIFTLRAGDLIFTGTPAGVGPIRAGDRLEAVLGREGGKYLMRMRVDAAG